jgi:serine/arginine repetitive matrix protein 2
MVRSHVAYFRTATELIPDNAVISLLDAATNDLAQLINKLDLEATPGSVEMTPMSQRSPFLLDPSANPPPNNRLATESPVKALQRKNSSMTSLRPYAQSCSKSTGVQLGQNIAPWSTLNAGISPSKPSPSTIRVNFQDNMATVRTHRRTLTPAPATDPSPVFKSLRPATTCLPASKTLVGAFPGISPFVINPIDRPPSTLTFGSGHSKSESRGSLAASPVFKKAQGHAHKRSLVPHAALDSGSLPILPEVRRSLGLAGTMGGSVGSITEQDYDGSDPDSDIPDELQVILSSSDQEGDDTISFDRQLAQPPLPSPGLPPEMPLPVLDTPSPKISLAEIPVFRATVIDEDEHHADVEEAETLSEDDTKRSFDFTGELEKLNESGASDRRSFIEQLENAFRTPAKVDLQYDFEDLPPIPKLPTLQDELSRVGENSFNLPIDYLSRELSPRGFPIDVNAERPRSDSFAITAPDEELLDLIAPQAPRNVTSVMSRPSDGELNRNFKFGGKHSSSSQKETSPLTLSDIIPPLEIARSLSMASFAGDESSLMKSILAHAIQIQSPPERPRLDSDSASMREARDAARKSFVVAGHQRNSSGLSFSGFDSFAEIRRGFEFNDSRPAFYPPPGTASDRDRKHNSVYSIASVSSYGNVLHSGSADPFDYGSVVPLPSLRERPSSDNFSFSMSTSVDDTFSFIRRQPLRCRVDSDTSSFYFRPSVAHPYNRSQRRPESGVSVGPPVSLFNRNSTYHRRGDSNTSMSSIAQSYANCRRFSWARHRSNLSVESVLSDFSGTHLGRPGLGDKMLESAQERGTPLASISASSPLSLAGSVRGERSHSEEYDNRTSYDSVMDGQYESQKTDSLFEKTRHRNSVCSSDSTFFEEHSGNAAAKPPRYRPISSLSIASVHTPPKEDDTMISVRFHSHLILLSDTQLDVGWWPRTASFRDIHDWCFPLHPSRATQEYSRQPS